MRRLCLALNVLAIILATCIVCADTEVIYPPFLRGWIVASQQGTGSWPPIGAFVVGPGLTPAGSGSFHMQTPYSHSDPLPKVYIGTNRYAGVALRDITSFKFWTYVHHREYDAGQPPMVEIFTDSGTTSQMRRFVFYPWGKDGNQNVQFDTWQEWDLMASDGHWELIGTSSTNYMGNWDWVKSRYGDANHPMKLIKPPLGDYITGVLTGAGINIKIGSGQAVDSRYGAWWQQSCQIDAYVDKLTIGVNGQETTYDFEYTGPPPPVFGISNRVIYDPIMQIAKDWWQFKIWGTVLEEGFGPESFLLDDGFGAPIRVYAYMHPAQPGNFVSATGAVDLSTTPPTLRTTAVNIKILAP